MRKILIMTIGSRGDVQPYVALGVGLKNAGYRVQVCTSELFRTFVEDHSLEFSPLPNDLVNLLGEDTGKQAIEEMQGVFGAFKTTIRLLPRIKPIIKGLMNSAWEAASAFEPDILLYNSKMPGVHIAEKLEIPCALAIPFPQLVSTSEMPTLGMPEMGPFNKASYYIVRLVMTLYGGFINEFRVKTLGLSKTSRFVGLHHHSNGEAVTVLHAFSKHIVPRPRDWPENSYVTGYWFLDDKDKPSRELVEFLENGEPPVYVGFGSMSGKNTARITKIVIDSLVKANVRGIIATGWGGLDPDDLPESILKIESAPHEWLFPRTAGVVHHGGAGTTAAGLRAGQPTVICPFFGDQPFWGKRVFDLGLGPKPIPQRRLTVNKLTEAIVTVTTDQDIISTAEQTGIRINEENGLKEAISVIDTL